MHNKYVKIALMCHSYMHISGVFRYFTSDFSYNLLFFVYLKGLNIAFK